MSIITKFLFSLFLVLLPFQKQKDKCLIIYLKNNKELYNIGSIADRGKDFYITLKLTEVSNEKKREELNPILSTGVVMNPTSTSYNLQNKEQIESLPDSFNACNCATLENFNLGMNFKLYVEEESGWLSYDARKLLVEE